MNSSIDTGPQSDTRMNGNSQAPATTVPGTDCRTAGNRSIHGAQRIWRRLRSNTVFVFLLGLCVGSATTVTLRWGQRAVQERRRAPDLELLQIVRGHFPAALKGARVLHAWAGPSGAEVNYVWDRLYDVHIEYERDGQIRRMVAQYGYYQGQWIVPSGTDLELLDARSAVVLGKTARQPRAK